jgi:hypothetical protein
LKSLEDSGKAAEANESDEVEANVADKANEADKAGAY